MRVIMMSLRFQQTFLMQNCVLLSPIYWGTSISVRQMEHRQAGVIRLHIRVMSKRGQTKYGVGAQVPGLIAAMENMCVDADGMDIIKKMANIESSSDIVRNTDMSPVMVWAVANKPKNMFATQKT